MINRVAIVMFFLLAGIMTVKTPAAADERMPREYEVKAAFVYNFTKFVEWPAASFANERAPFNICILGSNPFGKGFDPIRSKTVNNRAVVIRDIDDTGDAGGCQLVFVSSSEQPHMAAVLASLDKRSVLTVADMKNFAQSGGMINFVLAENKVRFNINTRASNRAGLKISSHLLKLAKTVIE